MRYALLVVLFVLALVALAGCVSNDPNAPLPFDAQVCGDGQAVVGPCSCPPSALRECFGTTPPLCGCVPMDAGTYDGGG